jgi:hypothetical protein
MHKPCRLLVLLAIAFAGVQAHAEVSEQEAIQAQLASALASSDYAAKKCPNLAIDQSKIDALAKRSGKTIAELKASEDYKEQQDVILSLAQGQQAALICVALPQSHGGYARGIITAK